MIQDNNSEITNSQSLQMAVRSRFFAQYWGTKTLYVGGVGKVELGNGGWNLKHPYFFLQLKPLSKITDEDAIEIVKIIDSKSNKFINVNYSFAEKKELPYIKSVISDKGRFDINDTFCFIIDKKVIDFSLNIFDFLRSRGYVIPFMEYSVDDLISFGWVQLL